MVIRVLVIDHYDSYTYNLIQLLKSTISDVGMIEVIVVEHDIDLNNDTRTRLTKKRVLNEDDIIKQWLDDIEHTHGMIDAILLSPGPGNPCNEKDAQLSTKILKFLLKEKHTYGNRIPVLGICLGFQLMGVICGAICMKGVSPAHGVISKITFNDKGLLFSEGIPKESLFNVVRYHSLVLSYLNFPSNCFEITAQTVSSSVDEPCVIMGIQHKHLPWHGVQFHPESICSDFGAQMMKNFLNLTSLKAAAAVVVALAPKQQTVSTPTMISEVEGHDYLVRIKKISVEQQRIDKFESELFDILFPKDSGARIWFDSSMKTSKMSQYSFMCTGDMLVSFRNHFVTVFSREKNEVSWDNGIDLPQETNIFHYLENITDQTKRRTKYSSINNTLGTMTNYPFPFCCGFAGYFGYESSSNVLFNTSTKQENSNTIKPMPSNAEDCCPDACFIFCNKVLVLDLVNSSIYAVALEQTNTEMRKSVGLSSIQVMDWFKYAESAIAKMMTNDPIPSLSGKESTLDMNDFLQKAKFHPTRSKAQYIEDIKKCFDFITEGDSYEICLTNQIVSSFVMEDENKCFSLYKEIRVRNPSPFGCFMQVLVGNSVHFTICSFSPERFLSIDQNKCITAKPIKGTYKRDIDPSADAANVEYLKQDLKTKAENLMITDLLRNDFGRICEDGSITVPVLMNIETYPHVHQMVSTIHGKIRSDVSNMEAVNVCFPGGSMTGAPKIKTIEIIEQLESTCRRGIYSGALGYYSLSNHLDFSIIIRTLIITKHGISLGVGGAIIYLSKPEDEWNEIVLKAKSVLGQSFSM